MTAWGWTRFWPMLGVPADVGVIGDKGPCSARRRAPGKSASADAGGIVFKHRSAADREIYFLSNTSDKPRRLHRLAAGERPQTQRCGTPTPAPSPMRPLSPRSDGRTLIPLHLDASESIFVVFGEQIGADVRERLASNTPDSEPVASLDGPWTVRFDGQGAPAETVFESLTDWAKHPDERDPALLRQRGV